jgi:TetR/AcrR family transcriptional repressor of nem operon
MTRMPAPADKTRAELKRESLGRILLAGSRRLRREGLDRTAIVPVMRDARLTHGAFYAHFSGKDQLTIACFVDAVRRGGKRWIGSVKDASWSQRLKRMAGRYLSTAHRDDLADGCAFTALSSDTGRAGSDFQAVYARELRRLLDAIAESGPADDAEPARLDDAIALMALCMGGLALSRAVADRPFSDRILRACNTAAGVIADRADQKIAQGEYR